MSTLPTPGTGIGAADHGGGLVVSREKDPSSPTTTTATTTSGSSGSGESWESTSFLHQHEDERQLPERGWWWWWPKRLYDWTTTTQCLLVLLVLLLGLLGYLISTLVMAPATGGPLMSPPPPPPLPPATDCVPSSCNSSLLSLSSFPPPPPPPPQYRVIPIRQGAVVARIQYDTNAPSVVEIPSWIPPKHRAHVTARYYLYYSSHTTKYISLSWSTSLFGPWIPYNHHHQQNHNETFTPRGVLDFEADVDRWDWDHVASPDVTFEAAQKRVVMYFHGRNGQAPIHHASFVATSRWGLNFNGPAAGGEGPPYGPVTLPQQQQQHDKNQTPPLVCLTEMYPRVFYQPQLLSSNESSDENDDNDNDDDYYRGPYLMSKRGIISRPPNLDHPFVPPPGRESKCFWKRNPPLADWQNNHNYSNAREIQPRYVSALSTFLASEEFASHPNNPRPGTRLWSQGRGWNANHVALAPLHDGTSRLEVYFWIKKHYHDLYRVILDVSSPHWERWHLARNASTLEVYFDVILRPQDASRMIRLQLPQDQRRNATSHAVAIHSLGDPFVFVKGRKQGKRFLFVSYSSKISCNDHFDVVGQGQITSFRLVPR